MTTKKKKQRRRSYEEKLTPQERQALKIFAKRFVEVITLGETKPR